MKFFCVGPPGPSATRIADSIFPIVDFQFRVSRHVLNNHCEMFDSEFPDSFKVIQAYKH